MTEQSYKYRGARAMVMLHEKHMRSCIDIWKKAKTANITLPQTEDRDYQSLDHLIHHVCRAARGYIIWICKKLELPDPEFRQTPDIEAIESELNEYVEHLLEQWIKPLVDIEEKRFYEVYTARWKVDYCIDAMLEHAVMHPIRHQFQLEELMESQS